MPQNGAGEGFFYATPISQCTAGLHAHVLTATYASGTFTGLFCVNGKGFGTYTQGNTDWVRLGHRREGHYRHWCLGQEPVIGGDNEGHQEFVRRVGSGIIQVRDVHIELGARGVLGPSNGFWSLKTKLIENHMGSMQSGSFSRPLSPQRRRKRRARSRHSFGIVNYSNARLG